jgi:hypothetical protein
LPEDGGNFRYDLSFKEITNKRSFEKYYDICLIRTTDIMIRHNARISFPASYKVVVSDCATFAHNFVLKTITRAHDDRFIDDARFKAIKKLVQHNTVIVGTIGETEGLSRRNLEVLGESAGATIVESYGATIILAEHQCWNR